MVAIFSNNDNVGVVGVSAIFQVVGYESRFLTLIVIECRAGYVCLTRRFSNAWATLRSSLCMRPL